MERIYVPKDKCPLTLLVEKSAELKNAWIFVSDDVRESLKKESFYWGKDEEGYINYSIHKTETYPAKNIRIMVHFIDNWSLCNDITLNCNTVIHERPKHSVPDRIVFLEMEK